MKRIFTVSGPACLALMTVAVIVTGCDEPRYDQPETAPPVMEAPLPIEPEPPVSPTPIETPSAPDATPDTLPPEDRASEETVQPESETLFY